MATGRRAGSARAGSGRAAGRRSGQGKRSGSQRAGRSRQAGRQELARVVRTPDGHQVKGPSEDSVMDVMVELFADSLRLASSLVAAPSRILAVLRRERDRGE